MINLRPTVCNICGGEVELVEIKGIRQQNLKQGRKSGYFYRCKQCGASVGTHRNEPDKAYGLLADKKMAEARQKCHAMFDNLWKNKNDRSKLYKKLAKAMEIPEEECHFGYFTLEQLEKAYEIMKKWWFETYDK